MILSETYKKRLQELAEIRSSKEIEGIDEKFSQFFHSFKIFIIFISMGRKKKYNTDEDKIEAQRKWNMEYYERNKDIIKKRALERYYEKRDKNMQ